MKLEVFSDPLWAIRGGGDVEIDEISQAVEYDTRLLKPALLVADDINLRTWRLDTRKQEVYRSNLARFPVPAVGLLRMIVAQGPSNAVRGLDITVDVFQQLEQLVAQTPRDSLPSEAWWLHPVTQGCLRKWVTSRRRVYDNLSAPAIEALEAAGTITQSPWDEREADSIPAIHEYEKTTDDHAWSSMLSSLSTSSDAIMLDSGVQSRLPSAITGEPVSAGELRRMADLMSMISVLATASLDEVVDIRETFRSQLLPFRAFLLDIARSSEISEAGSVVEANRQVQMAWETRVLPSVADLEESIKRDSFLRGLAREALTTSGALLTVGVGVAGAMAAGPLGITALTGIGTAAMPVLTRAIQATAAAKKARKENPVFFVVEAQRYFSR